MPQDTYNLKDLLSDARLSIVIPKIQRDYAQGRTDDHATRTRNNFLTALHDGVMKDGILLDFIYGNISPVNDKDGNITERHFIPLDGQQRLTTLWLLHWYASRRDNIPETENAMLERFSYATRPDAREFCHLLATDKAVDVTSLAVAVSGQLADFVPAQWLREPTIASMLVMLDEIQRRFADVPDLWHRLDNVRFYYRSLDSLSLTDDIYIKMNSRGKPLTSFEHFKAHLQAIASDILGATEADALLRHLDGAWTDMMWPYAWANKKALDEAQRRPGYQPDNDPDVDTLFMRFFRYVFDMLGWMGRGTDDTDTDGIALLDEYLKARTFNDQQAQEREKQRVEGNLILLMRYFEAWERIASRGGIEAFFGRYIAPVHDSATVKVCSDYGPDLFADCVNNFGNVFPLTETVLFEAFTTMVMEGLENHPDIRRRLRLVNNLVLNSRNEIRQENIGTLLAQTRHIVAKGQYDATIQTASFNKAQMDEEEKKAAFWKTHTPGEVEALRALEDYRLVYGKVAVVGLDDPALFHKFRQLFDLNWDLVDRALMATGDYSQSLSYDRIRCGSRDQQWAWSYLFHNDAQVAKTSQVLCRLLQGFDGTPAYLDKVINAFITDCEAKQRYPWRYYYVKYDTFRPGRYGVYYFYDAQGYKMTAVYAPEWMSNNAYDPYLDALREASGGRVSCRKSDNRTTPYIYTLNDAPLAFDTDALVISHADGAERRLPIQQDADGIDTVDRIESLKFKV